MGPTLRRLEQRIRCVLGDHELFRELVPADADKGTPARIRLRCLHCPKVTPGWEQGRPAYAVRPGCGRDVQAPAAQAPADAQPAAAVEPQPAAPDPVAQPVRKRRRRTVRRSIRRPVTLPAAAAGGGRRIVNFPLARKSRSR